MVGYENHEKLGSHLMMTPALESVALITIILSIAQGPWNEVAWNLKCYSRERERERERKENDFYSQCSVLQYNSKKEKMCNFRKFKFIYWIRQRPNSTYKIENYFYLPTLLLTFFFQNNFRGRVHSLCMDFKTFLFLLVCIIMSVIVESYMYLLLLPLEGSLFSNLIGLMVGRKKK